ncbi:MAG: protein translocase subunit SecF [Deferribacteraceae bacterium]|jgi:preprotein translocase subunit SecF|nr:protein translocase subunit SecF [Deferribacteraceae bacterium]
MLQIIKPNTKIDFIGRAKRCITISIVLALTSAALIFFKGFNFGIDFIGGTVIQVRFENRVPLEDVRKTLEAPIGAEFTLQDFGDQNDVLIRVIETPGKNLQALSEAITGALKTSFEGNTVTISKVEQVGPQVGGELRRKAFTAVLYSTIGILIYIAFRFEFMFGIGAIICLLHDIIIAMGIYCLTGKEFNLTVMAAVLTVAGYSLNDTIVIFDRIRENLRNGGLDTMSWKELANKSVNETLSRTLLTSILTFSAVLALYLFGGEVINGFALMMLIGIVIGTYSSVMIAAAFMTFIRSRQPSPVLPAKTAAVRRK